ncbi:uncharacterized protein LOC112670444 isoform X2 [Canis lupus dingo]|uniref:uncharacterized protein LOC112670444 isoform X2 n=1 Tax=Canis lupus dingo TaxID=286419 RepID=UPI0020C1C807|nr:uncharacterized protein LOC112670444 isoform X2 [Canis lupus dingo]
MPAASQTRGTLASWPGTRGSPGPRTTVLRLPAASATGGRAEKAMGMPEGTRGRQWARAAFWVGDSGQPCLLEGSPGGPPPPRPAARAYRWDVCAIHPAPAGTALAPRLLPRAPSSRGPPGSAGLVAVEGAPPMRSPLLPDLAVLLSKYDSLFFSRLLSAPPRPSPEPSSPSAVSTPEPSQPPPPPPPPPPPSPIPAST